MTAPRADLARSDDSDHRPVREALAEREVLLASAPRIIHPLKIALPDHAASSAG